MNLMAVSSDLVMLFLAIETTSIPLYVLAGFLLADDKSTEAGFKYLLFGILTTTIMLYGFSLVFGFAGTTDLYQLADMLKSWRSISGECIWRTGAHPGGDWFQSIHCAIPLLGARCV